MTWMCLFFFLLLSISCPVHFVGLVGFYLSNVHVTPPCNSPHPHPTFCTLPNKATHETYKATSSKNRWRIFCKAVNKMHWKIGLCWYISLTSNQMHRTSYSLITFHRYYYCCNLRSWSRCPEETRQPQLVSPRFHLFRLCCLEWDKDVWWVRVWGSVLQCG